MEWYSLNSSQEKKPPLRKPSTGFSFEVEPFKAQLPPDCPSALIELAVTCSAQQPEQRPSFRDALVKLKALVKELEEQEEKDKKDKEKSKKKKKIILQKNIEKKPLKKKKNGELKEGKKKLLKMPLRLQPVLVVLPLLAKVWMVVRKRKRKRKRNEPYSKCLLFSSLLSIQQKKIHFFYLT